MLCSRCKKRIAVVFMTHLDENGKTTSEGLCLQCARELGIKPVDDLMNKMGISGDELDAISDQMMEAMQDGEEEDFQPGGAQSFPFLSGIFGGNMPAGAGDTPAQEKKPPKKEKREKEKKQELKYLPAYCENLTEKARQNGFDPIVGREREIYRVVQILNRRTKNNPCLIGEPGVGKTAIAEGIAQRIVSGDVPAKLAEKELWLLDLTALVAGTQFRGQFESRVKGLVDEVKHEGNIILFIDEIHSLVGTGDTEGGMNAANILKPSLSRGEIQVIGATTFDEYRKYIEKDAALERRFQPVTVEEPTLEETFQILKGIAPNYEKFHHVSVSDGILRDCARLSERYITDRFLPDKAIDLLDEACSCAALANKELAEYEITGQKIRAAEEKISDLEQDEEIDYETLAKAKSELIQLEEEHKRLEPIALAAEVTEHDLAVVIELWTGIPASKVQESDLQKLGQLESELKAKVIGQDEACELVAAAVRRSRVQISARRRPASFIFVGPTGVGKTELVKVLANCLFQGTDPLIRLDMSEFMEKFAVSRIVGSPPGYVGYDEAGQLTEKVRRKPYSVILFDEIEKAHPDVMNILLQILDEGKIADAHGRVVSFANTVIIMTSNAGSDRHDNALGFNQTEYSAEKEKVRKALSEFLRPEFLGRVDEIVVFHALTKENYERIAALRLEELRGPLQEKSIVLTYDDAALKAVAEKSFGGKSGARDLVRVIRKEVEDRICTMLVEHADQKLESVLVSAQDGVLNVTGTEVPRELPKATPKTAPQEKPQKAAPEAVLPAPQEPVPEKTDEKNPGAPEKPDDPEKSNQTTE
ncbi:MAG TPA: ATP-dependent Clp protease ATP-binding subunit [Oscillospiraceae bacterium]|nr:ATP-dependent Clp protease ATP-binding subunit [Oscillospiraceae bacterium]HRW56735.1 ATP-dependent Clp protease ATP-binding subunit [Oscillospiraceae bacterium]